METKSASAAFGAVLVVGMRWTDRLIGVISTVVLARLLLPVDFGIVAMASLVIGLIDVMMDLGVNMALVQNKNATQQDFDTAWTLRLIQSAIAAVVIFLAAYPAAQYFNDPRVAPVVQVLSLSVLLQGFENIGIVVFQKKMNFGQEFRFFIGKRIFGFVVTLAGAWILGTYWALVIGTLAGRGMGILLSYLMHEMRPRASLVGARSILAFSAWNLMRGIGAYLSENLHRILVGGRESSAMMGSYTLASDIAAMPSTELLAPLNRVLFPVFVETRDDPPRFRRAFLLAISIQATIGIPAGVALALLAPEIVFGLLGERWSAAIPFVQIMGCINIMSALGVSSSYVLLALGRAKLTAVHAWGQLFLFLLLALLANPSGGAMAIAAFRLIAAGAGLVMIWIFVKRERPDWQFSELLRWVWRPCLAAALTALVIHAIPALAIPALMALLLKSALLTLMYSGILWTLWHIAGRPDGAEAFIISKIGNVIRRRRQT